MYEVAASLANSFQTVGHSFGNTVYVRVSSQGSTVSSFALYAAMSNHQSQPHVYMRAEVPVFLAWLPGLGVECVYVCACVFQRIRALFDHCPVLFSPAIKGHFYLCA